MEGMNMMKREEYLGLYSYDRYQDVYTTAKDNDHRHWIGDVPVALNLVKFFTELKFKRPDIVLRVDKRPARYNGLEYTVFADVGIGFKDAPELVCGFIGIDMDKDRNILFTVTSERIKNEKYAAHSDGYRIKSTKNFANAVKNALQYIKPTSFDELIDRTGSDLERAVHKLRAPSDEKLYNATNIGKSIISEELRNMIATGYTPATESFKRAVKLLQDEGDEIKRMINYKPRKCFVWAKPDRVLYRIDDEEPCIAFNLQDVPEHIRDKIAVLQIGSNGSAIVDVGLKVSDSMYWVFI
jgi:hypothetical protein